MSNLSKLIGNRIKEVRKQKGLRQEDMEGLGISYKYFQRIERGKVNITLGTIEKIAEALGIDARELFLFQLDGSEEVNELVLAIRDIINSGNADSIKKLSIFVKDIL